MNITHANPSGTNDSGRYRFKKIAAGAFTSVTLITNPGTSHNSTADPKMIATARRATRDDFGSTNPA